MIPTNLSMKEFHAYLPLARKLFNHWLWNEPRVFTKFEAWLYLIQEARFEDSKLYDRNRVVVVKRGQVYVSIRFLAEAYTWSPKKVLAFLDLLASEGMIIRETVKGTQQTRITLCNYEIYNTPPEKREPAGKRTGNAQETLRKHSGNAQETKSNKENKENNNISPYSPPYGAGGDAAAKSWRNDFSIYLSELETAYRKLINDPVYIAARQKFHPTLNILLSMEKAYTDYWKKEAAWCKLIKSKSALPDWEQTFNNALTQRVNQVWLLKDEKHEKEQKHYSAH